jgi:hypothetical protein
MRDDRLSAEELTELVRRVFQPGPEDRALAVLVDLPDDEVPDNPRWRERRALAAGWARELAAARSVHGLEVALFLYRNVHSNNADLPASAWRWIGDSVPGHADAMSGRLEEPMESVLAAHQLVLAPTELSTTAPLKVLRRGSASAPPPCPASRGHGARPAARLRRDQPPGVVPQGAPRRLPGPPTFVSLWTGPLRTSLHLDLRHRTAHASGGLLPTPGTAGNLPSGEAYIVPYEGEIEDDPTSSAGTLPVQLGDEVVLFSIEANRATGITSRGPRSDEEQKRLAAEPARGNLAELGLGVLGDFGLAPIGEVLLDEKLGLHIAFGRSEHFGGQVGPRQFSRPEAVIHQDHVYLRELQPRVVAAEVVLHRTAGDPVELIRDGNYVIGFDN